MPFAVMRLRKSGGGGSGGTPALLSVTGTSITTNTNLHPIDMPASVSAGDLLIARLHQITAATIPATPSGWTFYANWAGTQNRLGVFYKIADGSEGGTQVGFTTTGNTKMAAQIFRVQSGTFNTGTPLDSATPATGTSTTPAPPALSPSWGAANTFWIIGCAVNQSGTLSVSVWPTANNNNLQNSVGAGLDLGLASCTDTATTATLTPSTYTVSPSAEWLADTIAVQPV